MALRKREILNKDLLDRFREMAEKEKEMACEDKREAVECIVYGSPKTGNIELFTNPRYLSLPPPLKSYI